jgi:hypothetical protein
METKRLVRLLILTDYLIVPPTSGGAMRMINPMIGLGKTGFYDITYLFQDWHSSEIRRKQKFFAPYPWVRLIGTRKRSQFSVNENEIRLEIPGQVLDSMDWTYYEKLQSLIQSNEYDLVQIEHSLMSWTVPLIRTIAPSLPIILDLHNVEALYYDRWIPLLTSESKRAEMTARWQKYKRWEEDTWCILSAPLRQLRDGR